MTDAMTDIASKTLGDSTSYAVFTDRFDPSLLNPMPRSLARERWGITGDEFDGFDVWTCHEATFMLDRGVPIAGTLKIVYDCHSEFMVESKSMKLYLNSFDMCRMGATYDIAVRAYEMQIASDLSAVTGTNVQVKFFGSVDYVSANHFNFIEYYDDIDWQMRNTDEFIQRPITDFTGEESHIEASPGLNVETDEFFTNALRSRCRHTKQKDTGLAAFHITSLNHVRRESVFRQMVSLREQNEFHEFCAEKLFCEIRPFIEGENSNLIVALLYSRRGSLDITPIRYIKPTVDTTMAMSTNYILGKVQGQ